MSFDYPLGLHTRGMVQVCPPRSSAAPCAAGACGVIFFFIHFYLPLCRLRKLSSMHYVDILSYNLLGWFIYPYASIWMRSEQIITCHLQIYYRSNHIGFVSLAQKLCKLTCRLTARAKHGTIMLMDIERYCIILFLSIRGYFSSVTNSQYEMYSIPNNKIHVFISIYVRLVSQSWFKKVNWGSHFGNN